MQEETTMIRATLTIAALAALAACDASMRAEPTDPLLEEGAGGGQEGADPPGTAGPNATPWWGLPA
jgi:hypothetical protein